MDGVRTALSSNPNQTDPFNSEEGVLNALVTIRNSAIAQDDKAVLRDLFLDYAGTEDAAKRQTLRAEIDKQIAKYANLFPELATKNEQAPATPSAPTASNSFRNTRPKPSFTNPPVTAAPVPPPAEPVALEPVMQTPPAPTPEPVVQTPPPVAAAPQAVDAKARIKEIKHDINKRAGNPVNLINLNEQVGQEYMASLLNAMKEVAAGGSATEALARLETAYKAADKVLGNQTPAAAPATPEPEPVAPPPPPVIETPPPVETPPVVAPEPVKEVPPVVQTPIVREPIVEREAPTPETIAPLRQPTGLYHRPIDEVDAEAKAKDAKPSALAALTRGLWSKETKEAQAEKEAGYPKNAPISESQLRKIKVSSPETTAPSAAKATIAAVASTKLTPLSQTSSLPEKITELQEAAKIREEAAKKPITDLKAEAVTNGLRVLLSEWKIFKSSGFLGTGPAGIDHPLYKKLSVLPMASVVAGRFEGATPEIKQSLSAYMTGWRYEQGIVHDMGETFDNYLRRVIKHILEKQRVKGQ